MKIIKINNEIEEKDFTGFDADFIVYNYQL